MKKPFCFALVVFMILCFSLTSFAQSEVKPIQLSLWNTVQLEDASTSIHGVRIALYGENEDVYGLDCGLVLKVNGDMIGYQSGFVNLVEGDVKGLHQGYLNMVGGDFLGWQQGTVNFVKGQTIGLQTGLFNSSNDLRGVQFGLVNMTGTLYGLQIGLVNINNSGIPHESLPLINYSF